MSSFTPLLLLSLIAISAIYSVSAIGIRTKQSAGVRGYLTCDGRPAAGVRVKLYDIDRSESKGFSEIY